MIPAALHGATFTFVFIFTFAKTTCTDIFNVSGLKISEKPAALVPRL
jgi:hypothetical protein